MDPRPKAGKAQTSPKKRITSEKERQLGYAPQAQEVSKLGPNKSPKKENPMRNKSYNAHFTIWAVYRRMPQWDGPP